MKRFRLLLFLSVLGTLSIFSHCTDDDFFTECAGCDDPDFPWSAPGSTECYATVADCEASERGECSICN